jgi:S1-C subfamily serine protease
VKKLLFTILFSLVLNVGASANEDKDFYISCSAKGNLVIGYSGQTFSEIIVDEYKITIGKGDIIQGNRAIKSIQLVNTNANVPNDFYLHRNPYDDSISLSNKIIEIGTSFIDEKKLEVYHTADISLISGIYKIFYKDKFINNQNDTLEYTATGTCEGLIPVLNYLEDNSRDKGSSSGTAFFITNKGHLLTNNHVVDGCEVSKINYKGKDYDTKLLATDKILDLALLKTDLRNKSYLNFSGNEAKKMQKIYVGGYPLGKGLSDDLKISSGIVSSLKGFEDNSNEIQIDAAINPGNSGGPIINEEGELVAIAVSGMSKDKTEGINFGIKASAAERFLKSNDLKASSSFFSSSKNNDELLEILEEATVYTYCN